MTALEKYLENHVNGWRVLFNKELVAYPTTPDECKPIFARLCGDLSPENLHCDGEITVAQARQKEKLFRSAWKELEGIYGTYVDEGEAFRWDV